MYFKWGFFDGKWFGYNDIIGENVWVIFLDDLLVVEEIFVEYFCLVKVDS